MEMREAGTEKNSHHWVIESYVEYVSRGTCKCGAVRFFANDFSKESIELAEDYNKKEGKEGSGHMVAKNESVKLEESAVVTEDAAVSGKGWYQSHKKEMIEDLITMDIDDFYKKWPIKRQVLSHLKSDKLYKSRVGVGELPVKEKKEPKSSKAKSPKSPKSPPEPLEKLPFKLKVISAENKLLSLGTFTVEAASELPAFPSLNDSWPFIVQEKWLEVYLQLRKLELEKKQ